MRQHLFLSVLTTAVVSYAHIYYPDIVSKDEVYRVANWLYGCHPYHNYSSLKNIVAPK